MIFSRQSLLCAGLLAFGLVAGIYLQHRWPLGRLVQPSTPRPTLAATTIADLAGIPPARRLVILVAGQSNAANYGTTPRAAGGKVYAFAQGKLYAATDPLPGGDGAGGSIWSRLGARLILTGDYDAVIFAVVAEGSTRATDWMEGGRCHPRLITTLQELAAARLPPDYFLWLQGESEGWSPASTGPAYRDALGQLHGAVRAHFPRVIFVAAQSTVGGSTPANEQIRLAQAAAANLPGALAGPDLDRLGRDDRRDGVHFNDRGLAAAAGLWLEALTVSLGQRNREGPSP